MTGSVPYIFNYGEIAKSQEVNEDFAYIMDDLEKRSDIDFSNITPAAIDVIKNNSVYPRNIGELVWSTFPQVDAALHLADGSLISGDGVYENFVRVIGEKYRTLRQSAIVTYNVDIVGSLVNTAGVLSSFSSSNYAKLPSVFNPAANDWTLTIYAKTSTSYTGEQFLIGSGVTSGANYQGIVIGMDSTGHTKLYLSSDGTSWNIANGVNGLTFLSNDTYYYFRLTRSEGRYTLSISEDGETWEEQNSVTAYQNIYVSSQPLCLGGNFSDSLNSNYWKGEIDLRESNIIVGSSFFWEGTIEDVPSFTSETSWQQAVATYGVCGKFVYDRINDTVRLPKITGFVEGTSDIYALGTLAQAGLPNITGSVGSRTGGIEWNSGAFYNLGSTAHINATLTGAGPGFGFDASRSNPIYGRSLTVQPQSLRYYVYVVVGTSTKTDIQVDLDNVITDLNRLSQAYITEAYSNGMSWYRIYSDGWCEQGGQISLNSGSGFLRVTYLKPFVSEPDIVITMKGCYLQSAFHGLHAINAQESTPTYFTTYIDSNTPYKNWRACGYLA